MHHRRATAPFACLNGSAHSVFSPGSGEGDHLTVAVTTRTHCTFGALIILNKSVQVLLLLYNVNVSGDTPVKKGSAQECCS